MEKNEYRKMFEFENDFWWYQGLHQLVLRYVKKLKNSKPNGAEPLKILDAGCGTGRMMELLEEYGEVEGFDYSEDAVLLCRERGLKNARQGDLNTWSAPPGTYDVIVSNDVICTSGVEDDMEAVKKFHQALKPGGIMILNLPAFMALRRRHDIAVSGKRRYRKKNTLKELKKIGFTSFKATYRLWPLFFIILLQKHLVERFQKKQPESDLKPLHPVLNRFFLGMHSIDNKLITVGIPQPIGSSLFLACKK